MAKFIKHVKQTRAKAIVSGPSGSGKTGLISSLANAGYRTCVVDADNGLDILNAYLTDAGKDNLHFITLANDASKKQSAWGQFARLVREGWKDEDEDLGKIQDWDKSTVLVIDTMNFLGKAALSSVLAKKGKKPDDQPELQEWGEAGRMVEKSIEYLTSSAFNCHLVVNTHLKAVEDSIGRTKFWPACVGSALPQDIGGYFNTTLRVDVKTSPKGDSRVIHTVSDNKMDLKTTDPNRFEADMPFDLVPFLKVYEE